MSKNKAPKSTPDTIELVEGTANQQPPDLDKAPVVKAERAIPKDLVDLFERFANAQSIAGMDPNLKPIDVRPGWAAKIRSAKEEVLTLKGMVADAVKKRLVGIVLNLEEDLQQYDPGTIYCINPYRKVARDATRGFSEIRWGISEFVEVQRQYTEHFVDRPTSLTYKIAEPAPKTADDMTDLIREAIEAECQGNFLREKTNEGIARAVFEFGLPRNEYPVVLLGFDEEDVRTISPMFSRILNADLSNLTETIKSI